MDGKLTNGFELLNRLRNEGTMLKVVDGGSVYLLKSSRIISVDDSLKPVEADSLLYVQPYAGPVYALRTASGRAITVTPEHPLLVNSKGRLVWRKANELENGDYLAFASMIPLSERVGFPDALTALQNLYDIVTWRECARYAAGTEGFTNFASMSGPDFDRLGMLAGLSKSKLATILGLGRYKLNAILTGKKSRDGSLAKLADAFRTIPITALRPGEWVASTRRRHGTTISRLREPEFDDDLVKWFAFLLSEGAVRRASVMVTQSIQMGMLSEVLAITRRKFGMEFEQVNKMDYHLNCKALVDYLRLRFSIEVGPKRKANMPSWILQLSQSQKALFARWFFTLDGGFSQAGQISLTQVNERSIVMFGYLLASFGITARFSRKRVRTGTGDRSYYTLSISGRRDLETFASQIGFEDSRIQARLMAYLASIKARSKTSDFSIPIDMRAIKDMLQTLGVLREALRPDPRFGAMKRTEWYGAYQDARYSGRISREKLVKIIACSEEQIGRLACSLRELKADRDPITTHMSLAGLSRAESATELGVTRKVLFRMLRQNRPVEMATLAGVVIRKTNENIQRGGQTLEQLKKLANSALCFDKIRAVEVKEYSGLIFDLTVPKFENFIGGVGAIVCHNTSTVASITGVWASAHSEELRRGITIKVGYADAAFYKCAHTPVPAAYSTSAKCPVCGKETKLLRAVSFVDCPGHESLMTNMLAGAFLMDGALLVIAANEPVPKPQTREHLQALQMLGMKRIVIAQNKVDLVTDEEAKKNYEAIEGFVANTVAADAPIIPISAQQKRNIDVLIEALEEVVPTPKRDPKADALMYVVRSFDVNKPGTDVAGLSGGVLGGSLVKGELRVGEEVELRPGMVDERTGKYSPVVTKISSLQTGAGPTETVGPGGLVALGTHLDPTFTKGDQMVGSVIGRPGTLPPTWEHATLTLELFETAVGSAELVKVDKVRPAENLRLNLGTASSPAVVTSARGDVIEVDLKKPVAVEAGMRAAVSRRIAERWRLIGSGVLK